MRYLLVALLAILLGSPASLSADVAFSVTLDPQAAAAPITGRLVVSLVPVAPGRNQRSPLDAPFWTEQTPMFGRDVADWKPGVAAEVGASADFSTVKLAELPKGEYLAAAWVIANRETSSWKNDPGNFYGAPARIIVDPTKADPIALMITQRTKAPELPKLEGVDWFTIPSKLLGEFHGKEVSLKAGVVLPAGYDPKKSYGAIYWIPGFGDGREDALRFARLWHTDRSDTPEGALAKRAFLIVLDPESPNGHALWADSDNNGPWAQALVTELVPALEAKYPLIPKPHARLLRGHSSGGWSSVWLAINHPDVFGGAWASAPDPVSFARFQNVDIYRYTSMYKPAGLRDPDWELNAAESPDFPSYRQSGKVLMSIRQENGGERVLGANQTSGQQWHSWQAVFGPRVGERGWGRGHPAALYDSVTGAIDLGVAEHFKKYDIAHLLQLSPKKYGPLLSNRVRIAVGEDDNFYLNEAVASLKSHLEHLGYAARISVVPATDHGTVLGSPEVRGFPAEMLKVLEAGGGENAPKK